MKVFIAAPLFNEMERARNAEMKNFLISLGYEVYLAQDDIGLSYDLIDDVILRTDIRRKIFEADVSGIRESDVILILLDGRTPDEGACVEIGMGWALSKLCIGYKTDNRAMDENGDNNIMIDGCFDFALTIKNIHELEIILAQIKETLNPT